ncbi:hypothetical protein GS979_06680 [Rhodococcus hoagii]|nr:hypothetical protein [Prescottella equi]NKW46100.1 hypothetical protein [Prescottella equi]
MPQVTATAVSAPLMVSAKRSKPRAAKVSPVPLASTASSAIGVMKTSASR